MKTFSDRFILSMNHRLSDEDLEVLNKLSDYYTPWELGHKILEEDLEQILSRLILNRMPFSVAQRHVTTNGTLYTKFVHFDSDKRIIPNGNLIGQSYIDKEINKMNVILYGC